MSESRFVAVFGLGFFFPPVSHSFILFAVLGEGRLPSAAVWASSMFCASVVCEFKRLRARGWQSGVFLAAGQSVLPDYPGYFNQADAEPSFCDLL